jgi:hypothetical protein
MIYFQDPLVVTREKVAEVIASGGTPVVQYGAAVQVTNAAYVNAICREFGADVQLRFHGWEWKDFDCTLLGQFPDVANLSLDTLRTVSNVDLLGTLPKLSRLRFGAYEHPDGAFLRQLDLGRFTHLTLTENKRRNFDLAPLAEARGLEQLFIQGHDRGVEAISSLPRLSDVSLSGFPKRHDLSFLNGLASLRSLLIILGSRQSIAEFAHSDLRKLSIIWVRNLEDLGPLDRFANLEDLSIEDQLRLTVLDISKLNLRRLRVSNCKRLERIIGLDRQKKLDYFFTAETKLPAEQRGPLPES